FGEWTCVKDLRPGDRIAVARFLPEPADSKSWPALRLALLGQLIGDGSYLAGKPLRYTTSSVDNSEIVAKAAAQEFGSTVTSCLEIDSWHQLWISGNRNRWLPADEKMWFRCLGVIQQGTDEQYGPCHICSTANR